jgi:hypothetical protein
MAANIVKKKKQSLSNRMAASGIGAQAGAAGFDI